MGYDGFGSTGDVLTSGGSPNLPTYQPGGSGVFYSITPYIVGPSGDVNAQYTGMTAIQDAIDQAVIDGASDADPKDIYIKPGLYTETLVGAAGIRLLGLGTSQNMIQPDIAPQAAALIVSVSWASGVMVFENLDITAGSASIIIPDTGTIVVKNCQVNTGTYFIRADTGSVSCFLENVTAKSTSTRVFDFFNSGTTNLTINGCYFSGTALAAEYAAEGSLVMNVTNTYWDFPTSGSSFVTAGGGNINITFRDVFFASSVGRQTQGGTVVFNFHNCQFGGAAISCVRGDYFFYNCQSPSPSGFVENDTVGAPGNFYFYDCQIFEATASSTGNSSNWWITQSIGLLDLSGGNTFRTNAVSDISTRSTIINDTALSPSAGDGFLYIPSCAGAPSGTPTTYGTGVPIVLDSSGSALYFYNGSWQAALAAPTPPGQLSYFADAGSSPSGWLKCDGSAVSQSAYPALYAQVGLLNTPQTVWTSSDIGGISTPGSFAFGDSKFVVDIGNNTAGFLMTSTDGISWTETYSPGLLRVISFQDTLFLAGAANGSLNTSTDAITFTRRTSGTSSLIYQFSFGNGLYSYIGERAYGTSTDATTWTLNSQMSPYMPSFSPVSAFYSSNYYISTNVANYTSTDAVTWTTADPFIGGAANQLEFLNSLYLGAGDSGGILQTSTDGVTWTIRTSGTASAIDCFTFGNGIYIFGTVGGGLSTSTDAITWTSQTSGTSSSIGGLAYGAGLTEQYVYVGAGGVLRSSTDGVTWTSRTSGTISTLSGVAFGTVYFYGGFGGVLRTSTDGITWDSQTSGTTQNIQRVIYANGTYLYVTQAGGTLTSSVVGSSTDAITWSTVSLDPTSLRGIAFGNSNYVVCGGTGAVYSSTDLVTWTFSPVSPVLNTANVVYGSNFYLNANQDIGNPIGGSYTSTDGTAWVFSNRQSRVGWEEGIGWTGLVNDGTNFIAYGEAGSLSTSTDYVTWIKRNIGTAMDITSVYYGGSYVAFAAKTSALRSYMFGTSSDYTTWELTEVVKDNSLSGVGYNFGNLTYGAGVFVCGLGGSGGGNAKIFTTNSIYPYDTSTSFALPNDSTSELTFSGYGITKEQTSVFKRNLYIKT